MSAARIVGIDYGTRRVGIAVSDPLRMFARPHGTFAPAEALAELERLAASEGIDTVVIGWPLTPGGDAGLAVRRVEPFRNRVRKLLPGIPIVEWDERESSRRAVESLVDAGVPRGARRDRGRIDRAAAALILQEFLDEHRSADEA